MDSRTRKELLSALTLLTDKISKVPETPENMDLLARLAEFSVLLSRKHEVISRLGINTPKDFNFEPLLTLLSERYNGNLSELSDDLERIGRLLEEVDQNQVKADSLRNGRELIWALKDAISNKDLGIK